MEMQLEIWPRGQKIKGIDNRVDSRFFYFIDSYNDFESESVLAVAGKAYGLNLLHLAKLVYLEDEPDEEEINNVTQNIDELIAVAEKLKIAVKKNPDALAGKKYQAYDDTFSMMDDEVLDFLDESTVSFFMEGFRSSVEETRKMKAENPFPWNSYLSELEIVDHLEDFILILKAFKERGVQKVYLVGV
jgi:hypothetical protein